KFAIPCSTLSCELRNQRDTSKVMILVPLLNPKFALGFAASVCELRVRGTSANVNTALAHDAWMPYLHSLFALGSMVVCVRFRNSHSDPWFCRTAGCRLEDAMSAAYRVGNGPSGLAARFEPRAAWRRAYDAVRSETARRAAPLTAEDQAVQSMPDASPIKWHRAHTTWFFERFLLLPHAAAYEHFDPRFGYLFNSYYVAAGPRHARPRRGLITRPSVAEVGDYRAHVDAGVHKLISDARPERREVWLTLEIGLNHEQQHQELMLTDILHAFAQNPTAPTYDAGWRAPEARDNAGGFLTLAQGIHTVGHDREGFAFDNERPAHRVLVGPVRIARGLVRNREWLEFIRDGGYR